MEDTLQKLIYYNPHNIPSIFFDTNEFKGEYLEQILTDFIALLEISPFVPNTLSRKISVGHTDGKGKPLDYFIFDNCTEKDKSECNSSELVGEQISFPYKK